MRCKSMVPAFALVTLIATQAISQNVKGEIAVLPFEHGKGVTVMEAHFLTAYTVAQLERQFKNIRILNPSDLYSRTRQKNQIIDLKEKEDIEKLAGLGISRTLRGEVSRNETGYELALTFSDADSDKSIKDHYLLNTESGLFQPEAYGLFLFNRSGVADLLNGRIRENHRSFRNTLSFSWGSKLHSSSSVKTYYTPYSIAFHKSFVSWASIVMGFTFFSHNVVPTESWKGNYEHEEFGEENEFYALRTGLGVHYKKIKVFAARETKMSKVADGVETIPSYMMVYGLQYAISSGLILGAEGYFFIPIELEPDSQGYPYGQRAGLDYFPAISLGFQF